MKSDTEVVKFGIVAVDKCQVTEFKQEQRRRSVPQSGVYCNKSGANKPIVKLNYDIQSVEQALKPLDILVLQGMFVRKEVSLLPPPPTHYPTLKMGIHRVYIPHFKGCHKIIMPKEELYRRE